MLRSLHPNSLALGALALTCLGCSRAEEAQDAAQPPNATQPAGGPGPEEAPSTAVSGGARAADSVSDALANWNVAFDRALQVRGDHVADGVDAAIVVTRGLARQFSATRKQMFPESVASDVEQPALTVTVERLNPEAREAATRVRELASFDVASRGDAGDNEWLATLRSRSYDLRVEMNRCEKLPLTVEVQVENWPQPPAILSGRGGMQLQSQRAELQLRTMATFNAQAAATLRARRAQALAADEVLEVATQALNASLEAAGDDDVAELDSALKSARAEYLTATEDGDVDRLAEAANELASGLHALLQSRAIHAADADLLTARRAAVVEALEEHPASQTRRSVDAERAAEYGQKLRLGGRPGVRGGGSEQTAAERIALAEEDWRRHAETALEGLPSLESLEVDREIEDPWHRSGTEELATIDQLLVKGAAKLAELEGREASTRTELAAARARYAAAARALRAYDTAKQRWASVAKDGD